MNEVLKREEPYPLGDSLNQEEKIQFGIRDIGQIAYFANPTIMAVWTGEKRPPKKGEWYLSGAKICAYRAPNDFVDEYHIARLVKVETKTVRTIIG